VLTATGLVGACTKAGALDSDSPRLPKPTMTNCIVPNSAIAVNAIAMPLEGMEDLTVGGSWAIGFKISGNLKGKSFMCPYFSVESSSSNP
jgi:hypothetical protein